MYCITNRRHNYDFRSILLDSSEMTESINNNFVMGSDQKWIRDLLLMLDLGLSDAECALSVIYAHNHEFEWNRSDYIIVQDSRQPEKSAFGQNK